jgi:pilus assembly protein CpaC
VRDKIVSYLVCSTALSLVVCSGPLLLAQGPAQPAPSAGTSTQDSANDLVVAVGKSVLVDCAKPIERIAVGTGDFAEATAVSPNEVLLNGKAPGETTLIIWQAGGIRQFFNVTVRASSATTNDRLDSVRRELRTELPGQTLRVTSENGLVFLRGTVKDLRSSDRAVQIAGTAGKVVNLLYVNVPPPEPQILLKVLFASLD